MKGACDDCSERCEKRHGKLNRVPIYRFFKFVLYEDHSLHMHLPLAFARRVKHLANRETEIEDSDGERWRVTLSNVKDSLAFKKGWPEFYLDHGLKAGHLLVFNYVEGSHFTAHIFSTSACEVTSFNYDMSRRSKRRRRDEGTSSGNEFQNCKASLAVENAEAIKASGNLSATMPDFTQKARELQQMLNQMLGPLHAETTQHEVNLGNTLGEKMNLSCNGVLRPANSERNDIPLEPTKTAVEDAEMAVDDMGPITNNSGDNSTTKSEIALGGKTAVSCTEITEQIREKVDDTPMAPHSCQGGGLIKKVLEKPSDNASNLKTDLLNNVSSFQHGALGKPGLFSASSSIGTNKLAETEPALKSNFGNSMSSSAVKSPIGGRAIKKEVDMDANANANACHQLSQCGIAGKEPANMQYQAERRNPVVKIEPDLSYETGELKAINPLSTIPVEVKSQSYLELPSPMDTAPSRGTSKKTLILFLRGSTQELWPVAYNKYHDCRAFAANWTRFCKRNNIKPGDECRFQVEDLASAIYKVHVTRGSAGYPLLQLS